MKRLDLQGEDVRRVPRGPRPRSPREAATPGVGKSARQVALMEQLEQAKKERDDALKQIRDIHDEACRENAKRNREINEFRVQKGHTKAKFDQLEACVQSLNRSNTDFMRRQVSLEEAKTEIQAEIKKSQAMVQRLEKEVQMAKQPTESMREEVAKMRSRLSEVIKTKLVLQNEVAAARQRENQLREDLRLKMEAKETSQFPRSCLQFDMTAEEPGIEKRLDSDDDASGAEADEFDLEFTYEDATDLASYFPIARVASMGKRPSNKVQPEMTTAEFDSIMGELQEVVLELQGEKKNPSPVPKETAEKPRMDEQEFQKILGELEQAAKELSLGGIQEPSKSSNANVSEQPKAPEKKEPEPQGAPEVVTPAEQEEPPEPPEERPVPVVSGLALLSPYASFYKYAHLSR
mmetsp:Transcript_67809/g.148850  ORF Transcript_67809/g.148850 Transcript_67809/m.148850 type:complete len:406 (+) Transcript_67809:1-1218(+)